MTLKYLAEAAPYLQVEVTGPANAALARLQSHDVDLVVSDLRLPDMNALDLLREAKHRDILVPFIIVTGRGDETMATAALKLGAYDYLVKRDSYLTQLPYAIDNALSRLKLLMELPGAAAVAGVNGRNARAARYAPDTRPDWDRFH